MSVQKVREYLKDFGRDSQILEFPVSSATVELAAKALDVEPGRIAKTMSFHGNEDNDCILVVTAGDTKIDNAKFKKKFGFKAKMLGANEVSSLTGHEIGGVCPFANPAHVTTFLDVSLQRFETVYPAAGSSNSAIKLTPNELMEVSGALEWVDVCKAPDSVLLKYGTTTVSIDVSQAKSVKYLYGNDLPPITDLPAAFEKAVTNDVISCQPLDKLLTKEDLVTIIVSDITRLWMRQDLICGELVEFLHTKNKVPYENMVIVVALGTHRGHSEEEQKKVVGEAVYGKVRVVNHDALAEDLKYMGTTKRGTRVWVNALAVDRKVIMIGGTVHHLMAGFGGGRKSILPGIAGKQTIVQNHLLCLDPHMPRSTPAIGCGVLSGNPVHEDMMEAAAMVNPVFGINVITSLEGKHSHLICGDWKLAWEKSCKIVHEAFSVPLQEKADIVIASCGGFPKDINLYQGIKTLLNMSYAVKPGGTMIFIAECQEGGGSPDFFDWRLPLKKGILDEELRAHFSIAGYIFYAGCEAIAKGKVRMLTSFSKDLKPEVLRDMNISASSSMEELAQQVDFKDKSVYVMPYGGNTIPWTDPA